MFGSEWAGRGKAGGMVAQLGGGLVDHIFEPRGGVCVAVDVEVGVADHVGQQERLDVLERAILLPLFSEVADTVEAVGGGPILDRFFAVGPQEPDAVAFALFPS